GPDSDVLLRLARQTVELLKAIPGASDVSIEQEGPQPQLVIQPNQAMCARYNVRIEDLAKLINMAIGGEPVSVLFEGDRRVRNSGPPRPAIAEIRGSHRPAAGLHRRRRSHSAGASSHY